MPPPSEVVFLLLVLLGPLGLYRALPSTRGLPAFTGPQRLALFLLDLIRVAGCLFLPYSLAAFVWTLWDTHVGGCAQGAEFISLCWGDLQTGLALWTLIAGAATLPLTGLMWLSRRLRAEG